MAKTLRQKALASMREKKFEMTLEEAYLLKCAAWDGPEPTAREQRVLDRVLNRIEKTVDDEMVFVDKEIR